jgi:hypothetical protein
LHRYANGDIYDGEWVDDEMLIGKYTSVRNTFVCPTTGRRNKNVFKMCFGTNYKTMVPPRYKLCTNRATLQHRHCHLGVLNPVFLFRATVDLNRGLFIFLFRWVVVHSWANGDIYDGEWVDGKKHGNGKQTSVRACVPNNWQ